MESIQLIKEQFNLAPALASLRRMAWKMGAVVIVFVILQLVIGYFIEPQYHSVGFIIVPDIVLGFVLILMGLRAFRMFNKKAIDSNSPLGSLLMQLFGFIRQQQSGIELINALKEGKKITIEDEELLSSPLGKAVSGLRNKLEQFSQEEEKRNWDISGQAMLGNMLRQNLSMDIQELSNKFLKALIQYLGANQGGIYFIKESPGSEYMIQLVACYAYNRRKFLEKEIHYGEGLVGQCLIEGESIFLTDVPQDYITITSGLGEVNPTCIYLVPLIVNGEQHGVIEIASLHVFQSYQTEFIDKVADSFASIYSSVKSNRNMMQLLAASENITQELRQKEQRLIQNEEELKSAQEDLNNKLIELMSETNLTKSIIEAINKSNATVQFDMSGNILDANAMFLSVMGYTLEELQGQNERLFLLADEQEGEMYAMLWQSLKDGIFNSGEFKRLARNGKEVWMDLTYNPILDLNGKPFKILMLAVFTTEAKEKENEYRNKLQAVNESVPFLELNADYTIKSANQLFLDTLLLRRRDIKSASFIAMLNNGLNAECTAKVIDSEFTSSSTIHKTVVLMDTQGNPVYFELTLYRGKDLRGSASGLFALLHPTAGVQLI